MADTKISGLPASTVPLAGTEVLPIVQSSTTKQVSIANVTAGRAVSALSVATTADTTPSSSLGAFSYGTLTYADVNHLATFQTTVNSYAQVEIQNSNAGATASADMVVGNNNTTASTYYGDFGMNSSGWIGTAPFNSPNNVYLTSTTADLAIGTTTANNIFFGINGIEIARINTLNNILVNNTYDQGTGKVQITGNATFTGSVIENSLNLQGGNNLLTYSQLLTNGAWTQTNASIGSTTTAPDGTNTAYLLTEDSTTNSHTLNRASAFSSTTSPYTISTYAKAGGRTWIVLVPGFLSNAAVWFDIQNGAVGTIQSGATSASITSVGNGWFRCSIVVPAVGASSASVVYLATGNNNLSYAGNGTSGAYIWGVQLELGSVSSAYTPTTTTAVTTTNDIRVPSGSITISSGNLNIQRPIATTQVAPTIGSAATIAPTTYITFISGTTTINTITAPSPLSTYGGQIVLIPTGLFLTSVTGNIAIATTSVISKALIMIYDTTTAKWYPSY